jgi:hypothetical protein
VPLYRNCLCSTSVRSRLVHAGGQNRCCRRCSLPATLKRYTVPFFLSKSSSTNPRAVTIITAATPAGGGCSVRIDFFFGGDAVLACSLTDHVGKNRALNFCTRSTTKSYVSCAFTCSPELDFHQGKAVISTADTTACAKTAFGASVLLQRHNRG